MDMDKLVSLCRRRGFLFQSSEIYGGLNGFWDYGPLGVELKRNIKEAWWRDMVTGHDELVKPAGAPSTYEMVGLDCYDHHASAGVEVLGALRLVSRHDGRLPARRRSAIATTRSAAAGPSAKGSSVFVTIDCRRRRRRRYRSSGR